MVLYGTHTNRRKSINLRIAVNVFKNDRGSSPNFVLKISAAEALGK